MAPPGSGPILATIAATLTAAAICVLPPSAQAVQTPQKPIPVAPGTTGFGDDDKTSASAYLAIIDRYRNGTDDAPEKAIGVLASLPDGHSPNFVLKELDRIAFRFGVHERAAIVTKERKTMLANAWADVLPAAAVMHLETGFLLLELNQTDRALGHLSSARAIVDWSSAWALVNREREELEPVHARLRRDIYIGILWVLQTYRMFDQLLPQLERTRDQFPDDAMVTLAAGSFEEVRATVVEMSRQMPVSSTARIPLASWRRQSQQARWEKAIEYYRAALKADPTLIEARLRLGRVLSLRGKVKEARQELEAAVAAASEATPAPPVSGPRMVVPYLGALFLAEVIDDDGGGADALKMYQGIAARWPDCQSGLLALSRAHEARGEREASMNALQTLHREQPKRKCIDPWWTYNLGQGYRFGPLIVELRERVKGRS